MAVKAALLVTFKIILHYSLVFIRKKLFGITLFRDITQANIKNNISL